jgi:tetratricopeptide (TPR) repeat protein
MTCVRSRREIVAALICVLAVITAGCGSTPQAPAVAVQSEAPRVAPPEPPSPAAVFEERQREAALMAQRQQRLADAATAWDILTALRPDVVEYRERLLETQRQIDSAVANRLPRGVQAQQRGELDTAMQHYLAVLALQPHNAAAADALRAIERERNKRNYLGKYSRNTLTRRAMSDAEMPQAAGRLAERNKVEHAALLADDGQFDDAIRLLEARLASDRNDRDAQRLLASVLLRKAEALAATDRVAAIALLERSVRLDPGEPRARQRLKELKSRPATAAP